jgi:hypothetical protein
MRGVDKIVVLVVCKRQRRGREREKKRTGRTRLTNKYRKGRERNRIGLFFFSCVLKGYIKMSEIIIKNRMLYFHLFLT